MSWFLAAYGPLGGVNSGIYNCREVRGGGSYSLHAEGRACDLGIRPYRAQYGTELAELLRLYSAELGIQLIIWNRRYWSGSYPHSGWRAYSGVSPHEDHIHVELSWASARSLTVERILAVLNGGEEDEDDMAGAYPYDLPAADEADAGQPKNTDGTPTYQDFGHLEVIPLPLNSGGGAAKDGAKVWVSLYCGHGDVQVKQFEFKCDDSSKNKNHGPFVLKGGVRKWFEAPYSAHDVEVRYTSPLAWGAVVEWRKL